MGEVEPAPSFAGDFLERTYTGKAELFVQLDGRHVVGHDECQQRMDLVGLPGVGHQGVEQARACPAPLCRGVEVDGGLVAAHPHCRDAVGGVERPDQLSVRVIAGTSASVASRIIMRA